MINISAIVLFTFQVVVNKIFMGLYQDPPCCSGITITAEINNYL